MEVLNYVKDVPSIVVLPIIFLFVSAVAIFGVITWVIDEGWEPGIIAALAVSIMVFIGCIIWICNVHEDIFVYARMTDEKAFTEMVKDYDFVEEVAGIYKLRLK